MIRHGTPPYLECSSRGDYRFSAFRARIKGRGWRSIESIYQSSKIFPKDTPGVNPETGHMWSWMDAKGKASVNQAELNDLYEILWREYLTENPSFLEVIKSATGLSDVFGQPGRCCQATSLWKIRNEHLIGM